MKVNRRLLRQGPAAALGACLGLALVAVAQPAPSPSDPPPAPLAADAAPAPAPAASFHASLPLSPAEPMAYRVALEPSRVLPPARDFDVGLFEMMAEEMTFGQRVPGLAMAIVHSGRILSARGYGVTDVADPRAVDAHTVFRLASLSKAFAGTVTGLLVADGALRWDSKVSEHAPAFQLNDPWATAQVSVADLLSHRVGLKAYNAFDRDIEANASYQQVKLKLADATLECSPGECYAYQNVAFSVIGDVLARATGSDYEQLVRRRLLEPLGMSDASLGLDGIQSSPRWARPHVRSRNGWVSVAPKPTYYRLAPAAGVNASAADMAQWLLAQTGHRPDVLSAPLLATLHAPIVATPGEMRSSWRRERLNSAGYALGWRVFDYAGHQVVFHAGAVEGYRGMIALLPERDVGVAILWNSGSNVPGGLLPTILDRAIGLPTHRWLDDRLDVESLIARRAADPGHEVAGGASTQGAKASPR